MYGLNLEVTTQCPLRCPQCYCSLVGGKNLPLDIAINKLHEAKEHGVKLVHISGGETLCYPYLYDLIKVAKKMGLIVNVAISGWGFDTVVLDEFSLLEVDGIFVSLNGSTSDINSVTRDGYELAINALNILKYSNFRNSYINWVCHSNNISDFEDILLLAEEYNVKYLSILSFKPDANNKLLTFPRGREIRTLSEKIKAYNGPVKILVESCFSQLLAILKETKLLGNLNVGPEKGCRAGIYNYCVNVDGFYSPCRHLYYPEYYQTLDEYLKSSKVIEKIKNVDNNVKEPCKTCRYHNYCKPCLAVNSKLNGEIYIGHNICSLNID